MNFDRPYPEILASAWRLHQTKKSNCTVVSAFAGAGGSSLGYSIAGFDERLAAEWDDNAVAALERNFPGLPVYPGDIARLSRKECLRLTGLAPGELDILDGSPPCQGFSIAGKREVGDERNSLFTAFVRLLTYFKPRVFVMENVPGLAMGKMRRVYREICDALRKAGYVVEARLFNVKYYHVPQSRERVVFIGIRADLRAQISFPSPGSTIWTLEKALTGIDAVGPEIRGKIRAIAAFIKPGQNGGDVLGRMGRKKSYFNLIRTAWCRPCPTIVKTVSAGRDGLLHPDQANLLSIAAIKRLASFPDEFELMGSFQDQWARVGNGVPPLFIYHLARHLKERILDTLGSS